MILKSMTVIHLAAVTGKAMPEEYFKVNAKGTQFLIEQCQKARVRNFLYISTIAVKYPDKSHYHYAQSKELGEDAVKNSGLNYTIVRPTIVIGQDSPVWNSLSRLTRLPVTPIFGDGTTRIQPIYLDDLVDCILSILYERIFANETLEIGGPEVITFKDFLSQIHFAYYGKQPRVVHIPLKPLMHILSILEKRFYSILPVSVGQLYAFGNDGTIQRNRISQRHTPCMKNVQDMLKLVTNKS
jgi:NADH dehydrogenase